MAKTVISAKISVALRPLLRPGFAGETRLVRSDIPGAFSYPGVIIDDYGVRFVLNAPGLYVKDVTYAGRSVQYEPLRLGSAMAGATLRVTVGRDGGKLSVQVTDKDSNPVPDMRVLIMPAEVRSEGTLAATLVSGLTDQSGQYTSGTLAPGKYYIAASADSFDTTLESISKVWRSCSRFYEVDLAPNGAAQLKLEPVKID